MQGGGRMMERFEALGLTDDQKAQAQSIFRDQAQSMRGTGEQMRAAREALSNAVKQNASDAEIDKLAANLGNLMAQNTASSAKAMAKFYQILTPEQRQKLDAQMPRFMGSALRGHGARKAFKKNAA
jgi:Spy/CpxP family protein refolding chaperone